MHTEELKLFIDSEFQKEHFTGSVYTIFKELSDSSLDYDSFYDLYFNTPQGGRFIMKQLISHILEKKDVLACYKTNDIIVTIAREYNKKETK